MVTDGEIPVGQLDPGFHAVIVEPFHGGLEQSDAAVVAELAHIGSRVADVFKPGMVAGIGQDFQFRRLVQRLPPGNC